MSANATTRRRARLGDLLVARGVISDEQLRHALEVQQGGQQDRLIGEILVDLGYASQEQVLSAVAEACGVPFARLVPQLVDSAVRSALPASFIQKHCVLPLFRVRDVLTVAICEPSNVFLVDEIAHAAGLSVQVVAATAENIYRMLDETRPDGQETAAMADEPAAGLSLADGILLPDDYETMYGTWPAEKVAGLLIREAVRARASAIHLEPDEKVLRIRFRIDGTLHVVMRPPARLAEGLAAAFCEMLGVSASGSQVPDHHRSARLLVQGQPVQLHVTGLGGAFGRRTVVRLVREDEATRPLEKLGCDFRLLSAYQDLLAEPRGLVLLAGPRESGVTTTLYSTLGALDPVRLNVCTFESSVHFALPGVNQFSPATCGTAEAAEVLPRLLGQQPDVLALDGVLDGRIAPHVLETSLEGRLVVAQIRAMDAADAVARMSALVPPDLLAEALRGVLAQRLARTVCLHCRVSHEPPAALRRRVGRTFGPVEEYVNGRGCSNCGQTGFLGRIGLFELAPMDAGFSDLVRRRASPEALRQSIREAGHPSMWIDGINKVRAGITSIEEIQRVLVGCPGGLADAVPAEEAAATPGRSP
ncbi:MAG: Flp pilus assembly complex ATPase component TadA [Planctomycetes bacterium]|nr:Flp pilus assembly complex ATPase component TadA [Planctomycetota bacterium]